MEASGLKNFATATRMWFWETAKTSADQNSKTIET
jgi:hypothetical protein